jgi:menaquinol-cytochrome c reductase cytochrome b/c subunit
MDMATETRAPGAPIRERNVSDQRGAPVLAASPRTRAVSPAQTEADTVQVWPHLVVIEFLGAVVFTINLILLSTLVNAPLEALANPDKTPNPSKAPWYFLNLQELLLHMNPALAGVIVPTVALIGLAAIPYIDKGSKGLGVWFYNERGPRIALFSGIFSAIIIGALIELDATIPIKDTLLGWLNTGGWAEALPQALAGSFLAADEPTARGILVEAIAGWIFPLIIMAFFMGVLVVLLRRMFRGLSTTELIIGLFSAFVATYVVLTFVGTFMRGEGQHLFPPWDPRCCGVVGQVIFKTLNPS